MKITRILAAIGAALWLAIAMPGAAMAQLQYPDSSSTGSVGTVVLKCLNSAGLAIPVGPLCANPVPVTAGSNSATSVYQEATIITGGTAQNLFSGATPANGFELINTSASEILYFRENGAATSAGAASPALQPGASYISPRGYKPTGPISVIGVTTGHGIVARAY